MKYFKVDLHSNGIFSQCFSKLRILSQWKKVRFDSANTTCKRNGQILCTFFKLMTTNSALSKSVSQSIIPD